MIRLRRRSAWLEHSNKDKGESQGLRLKRLVLQGVAVHAADCRRGTVRPRTRVALQTLTGDCLWEGKLRTVKVFAGVVGGGGGNLLSVGEVFALGGADDRLGSCAADRSF